uniref:Uncharacterized protein n=1 Tax=uncultured Alphaproteobacteria bacterium TaxID=91750 RepID=A0A6G8F2U9_9PROT|nr:hypothetical protein PlAlph_4580 [uncultured Alphaproteobacteria bacterium]
MKLWSKEALVLGGVYGVLETPRSLLGFENLAGIFLFCSSFVYLCFV